MSPRPAMILLTKIGAENGQVRNIDNSASDTMLRDHPPVPDPRAGGCLLFFGLPLLVSGVAVMMMPTWLLTAVGAAIALLGLYLVSSGAAGLKKKASLRKLKAEYPREPWRWDYPWHSRDVDYSETSLDRSVRHGRDRLRFAHFPFRTGEAVDAHLECGSKLASAPSIQLTLRYVKEVTSTTGGGQDRSTSRTLYLLHEVRQELNPVHFDADSGTIPIQIPLPAGDYANRLSQSPRRYWELEVVADAPGIDYAAHFLLPVYSA